MKSGRLSRQLFSSGSVPPIFGDIVLMVVIVGMVMIMRVRMLMVMIVRMVTMMMVMIVIVSLVRRM